MLIDEINDYLTDYVLTASFNPAKYRVSGGLYPYLIGLGAKRCH